MTAVNLMLAVFLSYEKLLVTSIQDLITSKTCDSIVSYSSFSLQNRGLLSSFILCIKKRILYYNENDARRVE